MVGVMGGEGSSGGGGSEQVREVRLRRACKTILRCSEACGGRVGVRACGLPKRREQHQRLPCLALPSL